MILIEEEIDTEIKEKKFVKRETGIWRSEGYTFNDKQVGLWKFHKYRTNINEEVIYIR